MFKKKPELYKERTNRLSIAAFVFSLASLAINYYNQYGKNASFDFQIGGRAKCWQADKKLIFVNTITVYNNGAQYGGIYKTIGTLTNLETNVTTNFYWNMFVHDENVGEKGKKFTPYTSFESWAQTIIVPARIAVQKQIQFKTKEDFNFIKGNYKLSFKFYFDTNKNSYYENIANFTVNDKDVIDWKEAALKFDSINNISSGSTVFNLRQLRSSKLRE